MIMRFARKVKAHGLRGAMRALRNRGVRILNRWVRIDRGDWDRWPLLGLGVGKDGMSKLHAASLSFRKAHKYSATNKGGWLFLTIAWPVLCVFWSLRALRQNGACAKRLTGSGYFAQLGHLCFVSLIGGLNPIHYYDFRLFRNRRWLNSRAYLSDREGYFLAGGINNLLGDIAQLDDKGEFYQQCQAAGLPAISPVAEFRDGQLVYPPERVEFPHSDLFAKPMCGGGGRDASLWTYSSEQDTWQNGSMVLAQSDLLTHFLQLSIQMERLLVQERAVNGPSVSPYSVNGLCTFRVVTLRMPDVEPEVLAVCLRMPTGNSVTDNMMGGGIAVGLDIGSGELEPAVSKHLDCDGYTHHPSTGARIAGAKIPDHLEILRLAVHAHRVFARFAIVGWDIAVTSDGPLLVEGNIGPSGGLIQLIRNTPLGSTPYKDCCLAWLAILET